MIASKKLVDGDYSEGKGNTDMSALWPWKKKTASIAEMTEGGGKCKMWAYKLHKAIGGEVIEVTPPFGAKFIGEVFTKDGRLISYKFQDHFAVRKGDMIYDKITGPQGLSFLEYKKLFKEGGWLNFKPVS